MRRALASLAPTVGLLTAGLLLPLAAAQDAPPPPGPKEVAGVRFAPPADAGWVEAPVTNRMRAAQYRPPRAAGDDEDAELVVFHFGGGGGSVEDNLARWISQFRQPDGGSSREAAKLERREVGGLAAHLIDLAGTYVAETRPGAGERVNKPGWRLLGAIVETPSGPFFVKLVGPSATVEAARPAFTRFVESFRAVS
ncbi:MAG: hypothetical protein M9894_30690 [Planctomycetes bacterium]|nr:hypothetical protein [Planctomycetota bacterium]